MRWFILKVFFIFIYLALLYGLVFADTASFLAKVGTDEKDVQIMVTGVDGIDTLTQMCEFEFVILFVAVVNATERTVVFTDKDKFILGFKDKTRTTNVSPKQVKDFDKLTDEIKAKSLQTIKEIYPNCSEGFLIYFNKTKKPKRDWIMMGLVSNLFGHIPFNRIDSSFIDGLDKVGDKLKQGLEDGTLNEDKTKRMLDEETKEKERDEESKEDQKL